MRPTRVYKKTKKTTVQLTSLLDLLFVMIFVSLIQQKSAAPIKVETVAEKKVVEQEVPPVAKPIIKPTAKPISTPAPIKPTRYTVRATFNFYGTPNNKALPRGSYVMQGQFDEKTRKLQLGGSHWIERPKHYDMVPLSGEINTANNEFRGRIEFQGCQEFTLKKVAQSGDKAISGSWKGEYSCSQGPTGLTLTIE